MREGSCIYRQAIGLLENLATEVVFRLFSAPTKFSTLLSPSVSICKSLRGGLSVAHAVFLSILFSSTTADNWKNAYSALIPRLKVHLNLKTRKTYFSPIEYTLSRYLRNVTRVFRVQNCKLHTCAQSSFTQITIFLAIGDTNRDRKDNLGNLWCTIGALETGIAHGQIRPRR